MHVDEIGLFDMAHRSIDAQTVMVPAPAGCSLGSEIPQVEVVWYDGTNSGVIAHIPPRCRGDSWEVGDYLTVPDTVPTPTPGQGVYYVTSATYQGATRYGRKTTAGHLTGRDPALLPACSRCAWGRLSGFEVAVGSWYVATPSIRTLD